MKKQDGWVSEYRRKKFLERHNSKNDELQYVIDYIDDEFKIPKTIAIMLDLDGTSDFINDETAKKFINQLNTLRIKFGASEATICISTHYDNPNKMIEVLDILSRNLNKHTQIGINFFYGGKYDYAKKESIPEEYGFNRDKVKTFYRYYVSALGKDNKWFAIIDDSIPQDTYRQFQNSHPMLVARPSQFFEESISKNNFMSISTTTKGFAGVIEVLDLYINSIKKLSPSKIMKMQRNMMTHLSSIELVDKISKRDYAFLERYFKEGFADEFDYDDFLFWLTTTTNNNVNLSKDELIHLNEILSLISQYFEKTNKSENVGKVLQLQRKLEKNNN